MVRVNTGIEAHTHAFVRTGGENTKFGIAPRRAAGASWPGSRSCRNCA